MSDRFDEVKRAEVKEWINARYGRLWSKHPWAFKLQISSVTLAAGSNSTSKGDIQHVLRVWDSSSDRGGNYHKLEAISPDLFYDWSNSLVGAYPSDITVVGGNIVSDRPASLARTLTVLGEKKFVPLVNDTDVPLIPSEFHMALVHGARSEGLKAENDPSWEGPEETYNQYYEDMKQAYLTEILGSVSAYPAWP